MRNIFFPHYLSGEPFLPTEASIPKLGVVVAQYNALVFNATFCDSIVAEVANTNSAVLNMRLIINPVNILVFSISRNLVFIHSYIISADGFYIIVDQSFHIVKLHSQTVLLPYDNFSSQFSLQPCLRGHSC